MGFNTEQADQSPDGKQGKHSKRRLWYVMVLSSLLLVVVLVLVAPTIVGRTSLRRSILPLAMGAYPADYQINAAELSWWKPVKLYDVTLEDLESKPMLEVDRVETEKPLAALATQRKHAGTVRLSKPKVHIRYDANGVNLARVWNAYPSASTESADATDFTLELVDGAIVDSGDLNLNADVKNLNGQLEFRDKLITGRLSADIAGGRLMANPIVSYEDGGVVLTATEAVTFDGLQLRPDQVNNWIALVAPMLSGATRLDGKLSGRIQAMRIPTARPSESTAEGQLEIEAGRIEAGPLSEAILNVGRRLYTLLERPEMGALPSGERWSVEVPQQTIAFQVQEGVVRHDSLTVSVGGLVLDTSGKVGFDNSVDVTLTTRIPEDWVDESEWLAGLANEKMTFRIRGTLSDPYLDDAALADLIERLGTRVVIEGVADAVEEPLLDLLGF